ncbi:hypothetical protein PIB30_006258 [Stylosanthes scabra]|uniref:Ribonuclease H1 N-terminal domain-containing protein n=1 Tax=Stylosanthes scabra TaxID=79078 RepID=A0ABU6Q567_9FABA|nr:hypothetical protein [Stylosanthes scabra]
MGEFYVVFVGKKPGIYPNWPFAAAQVIGYSRAVHMKYATAEGAVEAWNAFLDPPTVPAEGAQHALSDDVENLAAGDSVEKGKSHGLGVSEPLLSGSYPLGSMATFECHGEASGSASPTRVWATEEPDGRVVNLGGVVDAVEALEGRVSRLEVDGWELMMQVAQAMQQMAAMSIKEKKK